MSVHDEAVRLAIYRGYAESGRAPSTETIAIELTVNADSVRL